MITSLIRRTIVPGRAYAAIDIDRPGRTALAVAWLAGDGWRVGVDGGHTITVGPSKTRALNVMHEQASRYLDRAATRALLADRADRR